MSLIYRDLLSMDYRDSSHNIYIFQTVRTDRSNVGVEKEMHITIQNKIVYGPEKIMDTTIMQNLIVFLIFGCW